MTNGLQESRMREICTSGSMRGSDGRGIACNGRPSLSTLPSLRDTGLPIHRACPGVLKAVLPT